MLNLHVKGHGLFRWGHNFDGPLAMRQGPLNSYSPWEKGTYISHPLPFEQLRLITTDQQMITMLQRVYLPARVACDSRSPKCFLEENIFLDRRGMYFAALWAPN